MRDFIRTNLNAIEWTLGILAVLLPLIAWTGRVDFGNLTLYDIFPPLGLIAFGVMWTHFVVGALKRYSGIKQRSRNMYMPVSMGIVLALILLHPGLLWIALYMDGFGLPPQSHMQAYSSQLLFVSLGVLGLMIFLSYELKRFFGKKSWWKYIEWLQIVGMVAIFVHALGLGSELRLDWFMAVWVFYGVTLAAAVAYSQFIYRDKEIENES